MPTSSSSMPEVGEWTVCELHRTFLTCKDADDTEGQEAYSKLLGRVYPSIPFRPHKIDSTDATGPRLDKDDGDAGEGPPPESSFTAGERSVPAEENGRNFFLFKKIWKLGGFIFRHFQPLHPNVDLRKKVELFQGVSWHKTNQFLAFLSGADQVVVYDFEDQDCRNPSVLASDSQREVSAVEWRPNSGRTLAVACRGGVCIWTASYPGSIAPVRSGVVSFFGSPARNSGPQWKLVDVLRNPNSHPVTALSWSPLGRLLASASWESSEFIIWDVAQGIGTPLRRGLGGISFLKWSPKGDYLLSSNLNGSFYLWETDNWTSEKWSSANGSLVSAMWNPDGSVLLSAFDRATTLGALHFPGKPPSLDVHLLPVELPEIDSITGGVGRIEKMAWDGSGERLAVSFSGGDLNYTGLIAVYDTRKVPVISVSLLGFIRGPGSAAKPLMFSFYDQLKHGVLLSVCWSNGVCCTYPLIFK